MRAKQFKKNNKGSSIVTVLVAMMFITILGVTLLSMTYTGFLIKATERKGETNFYSATEVLDQIQAGFQEVAAEAIRVAYQDVLTNYNAYHAEFAEGENIDDKFHELVQEQLKEVEVGGERLFLVAGGSVSEQYNPQAIENMLKKADLESTWTVNEAKNTISSIQGSDGIKIEILLGEGDPRQTKVNFHATKVVFEGFEVSYTGEDGYNTLLSADIAIDIPSFQLASGSGFDATAITEYAMVAEETLHNATIGDHYVSGSIYAETIDLTGVTTIDNHFSNGMVITNGEVLLSGVKETVFADSTTLWVNNIDVGFGATLSLDGVVYAQNDLNLNGQNSEVNVNHEYYGFGYSNNEVTNTEILHGDEDTSSAILVNASGTRLNFEEVDELMLAGHGFIGSESSVMMGESISTKTNQRSYLAPVDAISNVIDGRGVIILDLTNPYVGDPIATYEWDKDVVLLTVDGIEKTMESYGADVVTNSVNLTSGQTVTYFYLRFDTVEHANEYFRDYFSEKPEEIAEYLSIYTELSLLPENAITSGHFMEQDGSTYSLGTSEEPIDLDFVKSIETAYQALGQNLSLDYQSEAPDLTPFYSVIHGKNINALMGDEVASEYGEDAMPETIEGAVSSSKASTTWKIWEFVDSAGAVRGLLVYGSSGAFSLAEISTLYRWDYSEVNAIIAVGGISVEIDRDYEGIVLSANDITMNAMNISSNQGAVLEAFDATLTSGDTVVEFRQFLEDADRQQEQVSGSESWEMTDLVSYVNWKEQ